jgi:bacterioferritin
MYKNWGLDGLNEHTYKASIKAMKQADSLIERVLFLEGLPNLQDLGKLLIGVDSLEMLQGDLELMTAIRTQLIEAVDHCESVSDYVSRELLEEMLEHTEDHIDWLETQLELAEKVGIQNYLQSKI